MIDRRPSDRSAAPAAPLPAAADLRRDPRLRDAQLHGLVALQVLLPVEAQHCKAVYGCADPACLRLVGAALKIRLDASELQELLELYGSTPPGQRSLPRFFDLLARYSRTIAFRASISSDARSTIQSRVC